MTHTPDTPQFWDRLFTKKFMPWDAAGVPAELANWLASGKTSGPRVLIPGCGHAHELDAFIRSGFCPTAIDFSTRAVCEAQKRLGSHAHHVLSADFFSFHSEEGPFDIVYERAFLASFPRSLWQDWAHTVSNQLKPGGLLIGYFVYGDDEDRPLPPYLLREDGLDLLIGRHFTRMSRVPASHSVPVFRGKEFWEIWRKIGA